MADDEEKSEAGSERRLRLAYEEGQVPIGRDAASLCALVAAVGALTAVAPRVKDGLVGVVTHALRELPTTPMADLPVASLKAALPLILVMGVAGLGATVATLAQTRGGFWFDLLLPDLSRLISGGKLKRLFSADLAIDTFVALVKSLAVAWALWSALRDDFLTLGRLFSAPAGAQLPALFGPLGRASGKVLGVLALLAGADLALQHLRFRKKVRMTRQELKREHREEEGDPLLKSRRKRRHRDLMKGLAKVEVPRADAVIVNPTHVAVAVRYRRDEGRAPRVLAKGKGELAEYMRDLARGNGVPIVQDILLARALHKRVKVGREVPADLFKGVAAVLAFVYRVTGRMPGGAARKPT